MSLEEYNGVRSTIIDDQTNPPAGNVSRLSTFIFGTAKSGPRHTPTRVTSENVRTIFGNVPIDSSFDTSLVRGYYEYVQSCRGVPDVSLIRVGTTAPASISLYENSVNLSGVLSYTLDGSAPSESMFIRALTEGAEMNEVEVDVTADDTTSLPSYMRITLPDGTVAGYNLSPQSDAPGVVTRVSDLAALINANPNLNEQIVAGFTPLEATVPITITAVSGEVTRTYDIEPDAPAVNESWGDKLLSIKEAYQSQEISGEISAGDATAELPVIPVKSMSEGVPTITDFIRLSSTETVLTVTPDLVGQTNYESSLYCSTVSGWDNSYDISGNSGHGWTFKLYVRRSGTSSNTELTLTTDYTIDSTTGAVTIVPALQVGDVYYASYRYEVTYAEAKRRSDLLSGDARSYFITGDQIIFGASQPAETLAYYTTNVYMTSSEITIDSFLDPVITFNNADNLPDEGGTVYLTVLYEPELPAATGTVLPGSVVQPGTLSGGTDGRILSKKDFKEAVKSAFEAVDLYPRRHNVVMGCYLDDTGSGYNSETGLAETQAINMWSDFLPYIDRASNLTSECDFEIPVRPIASLTQDSINTWITSLTTNSDTDINRPANIIDSVNNFRAEAPLGVFIVNIPEVNGGRRYFANPACIYAGYKQNMPYDRSATHDFIPGNVRDLGVKIFNAETIGKLNLKRYTTAILDYAGRFIWADAPTLGIKYRSQFDRQFVRDTTYLAVGMAREAAEKYIGKPRLPQYIISMKKDVSKAMDMLVPSVLRDFYVDVIPVVDGYITGRTKLRLTLTTAKEIRVVEIETSVSLAQ
jgi:hypothetical protein